MDEELDDPCVVYDKINDYKQAVENGCNIIEKPLHNNMKLCEIVDNELNVLEISRQKLTQAMRLF